MGTRQPPVKSQDRGVKRDRLDTLLTLLSPWADAKAISYERLGFLLGFTEDAVKKWFEREVLPPDAAVAAVRLGRAWGIVGLTLDWLYLGDEPGPLTVPAMGSGRPLAGPLAAGATPADALAQAVADGGATVKVPGEQAGKGKRA